MTSNSSNNHHEGSPSNTTNYQLRPLIISIESKLKKISMAPIETSKCCIYKVPESIRKINEAAYTPRVISIGPFHRNKHELQAMEEYKVRYLDDFLKRNSEVSLDMLLTEIKSYEASVRQCYAEDIKLSSDEFVEMLLLDGFFIIEHVRKFYPGTFQHARVNCEFLVGSKLYGDIIYDWSLLENQLPFFFLVDLHELVYPHKKAGAYFLKICSGYFSHFNKQNIQLKQKVLHFNEMIRTFYLPSKPRSEPTPTRAKVEIGKISYSATALHKAGVTFVASSSNCLFDIKFTPDGVLEIPRLRFEEGTESLFRNLMAFEQCHFTDRTFCNYIALMDKLVDTEKDVELLVRKGILSNRLADHDVLANVINSLDREIIHYHEKGYFDKLYEDLDKYYNYRWHSWEATLRRDYFSNPWKIASVVAATILLILTLLQTITSFLSLKKH